MDRITRSEFDALFQKISTLTLAVLDGRDEKENLIAVAASIEKFLQSKNFDQISDLPASVQTSV